MAVPMFRILRPLSIAFLLSTMAIAQSKAPDPADEFAAKVFRPARPADGSDLDDLSYRLLEPKNIEPGKKYPLVLFMHGKGERGDENAKQLKHAAADFIRNRDRYPAYVVFPQCPETHQWVNTDWGLADGTDTFPEEPSAPMSLALQLVDSIASKDSVDTSRMYVCGLSMGGYGTWYAASAKPQRFAAAIPVCGGGDPTWADRYTGVAIWSHHGDADTVVPVVRSRQMTSAIAMSGHAPEHRQTEYPGVGHDCWTRTFANDEIFDWIFSKSKR